MTVCEELDRWCGSVPDLVRKSEGFWTVAGSTDVSYPSEGLAHLAAVEPASYWFNHRNDIIGSVLKRFPPDGTMFDIGGGNGYVSLGLQKYGFDCIVVEPDEQGAAVAQRRGVPVIRAAFQDLQIAPGSLASAGMFDVLEHIEDDYGALADLRAALKPRGLIYIAVPAYGALWSSEDVYAGHFRRYTVPNLTDRLHASGFEPLYGTYFFAALVPAIFLLRTVPTLFGQKAKSDGGDASSDHALPSGVVGSMMSASFALELSRISSGKRVGAGSSCLVVARKM